MPEQQQMHLFFVSIRRIKTLVVLVFLFLTTGIFGQELEPRSLTNIPIGTQFAAAAYGYSQGSILLDPSLPIEDLSAKVNSFIGAYVRAFNFFGTSAKFDVVVPWSSAYWEGIFEANDTSTSRLGMGDPRFRLSVNFIGAPALSTNEYANYQQKNIVGASLQVISPLGQYYSEKLMNLGSNRWTFRPQLGLSHKLDKWYFEGYVGLWVFTSNARFYGTNTLTQKPIFTTKVHLIRTLPKGLWSALSFGYGIGGQSYLNGELKDNRQSNFRFGLTLAVPVRKRHALKFTYFSSIRFEKGYDISSFVLAYQYRWHVRKN